jgi:hypothetical protein
LGSDFAFSANTAMHSDVAGILLTYIVATLKTDATAAGQ